MENDPKPRRHKGMGIASFSMALVAIVVFVLFILVILYFEETGTDDAVETFQTVSGLSLLFFVVISLVGIGLGVAGVFDKRSKKVFPILGITLGMAPWVWWLYGLPWVWWLYDLLVGQYTLFHT